MPSKTSKRSRKPSRPQPPEFRVWKAANACSEPELTALARGLATQLGPGHRVLLEGPLGAGKTTFSRALIEGLGAVQPPEGSPSFAIAHEYRAPRGEVVHVDFYRLRSEDEIAEAGIEAYFWERPAIVLAEWTSLWPGFEQAVLREGAGRVWRVSLAFVEDSPATREVRIERL